MARQTPDRGAALYRLRVWTERAWSARPAGGRPLGDYCPGLGWVGGGLVGVMDEDDPVWHRTKGPAVGAIAYRIDVALASASDWQ